MAADKQLNRSRRHAMSVVLGLALPVLVTVAPVSSTWAGAQMAAPTPQLSITVDDGRTSATVGDKLVYTITVRNLGTAEVLGLHVIQTVPTGLILESAVPSGRVQAGGVSWQVGLTANGEDTFHSTMMVSNTPTTLLRMATVVCASTSATGPPIVCASHSDQLPAGATARARQAATKSATASGGPRWWYIPGGILVLAVVVTLTALLVRRRKAHQAV